MFQSLIGDYALLPRVFGLEDYVELNSQVEIAGVVWNEFLSTDPVREVQWAQQLARSARFPMAIVGLIDFSSSELEQTLDVYESCQNVTAVRQHLGWDRYAPTGDSPNETTCSETENGRLV